MVDFDTSLVETPRNVSNSVIGQIRQNAERVGVEVTFAKYRRGLNDVIVIVYPNDEYTKERVAAILKYFAGRSMLEHIERSPDEAS